MISCKKLTGRSSFVSTLDLPDALVAGNGILVESAQVWQEKRRPEILSLFRSHVYGNAPVIRPEEVTGVVMAERSRAFEGLADYRLVKIGLRGGHQFPCTFYFPIQERKIRGCIILISKSCPRVIDEAESSASGYWPVREILARGYIAAAFYYNDVAPDDKADACSSGVFTASTSGTDRRPDDAWGSVAAWAWGASRVLDYLTLLPEMKGIPIAVAGHSRCGKAALWCGAQDERVSLTISNESGSTGAALARTTRGETVEKINEVFPHWFARKYHTYGDRVHALPVDQHMLIGLIAPRLAYVASAAEDLYADPQAEFASCIEAQKIYALFGLEGVGSLAFPEVEQPLATGHIGYHVRSGKHDLTRYDWNCFLDFADRHFPH